MQERFTQDGVIYETVGNGQVRVIGYEDAPTPEAGPRPFRVGTPDPYKAPGARLDYIQEEAAVNRIPFDNTKAAADARAAVANADKAERDARGEAPKSATEIELAAKASSEQKRADTVRSIMGRARQLYDADIKGQPASRLWGLTEKIGVIPENERFSSTSMGMLALIRPLVAQTAKEGDSDKEMEVFLSYIPSAGDSDKTIEEKFANLERLIGGMVEGKAPSETQTSITSDGDGVVGRQFKTFGPTNVAEFAAGMVGGQYDITEDGGLSYNGQPIDVSAEISNSDQFRQAYRQKFGKELTGIFVDLEAGETPEAMQSRLGRQRDTTFGAIDATMRGAADTLSLGLADPLAAAARSAFNDDGFAANYARERAISQADEAVNPYARFGGQVAGSFPVGVGAARLGAAALPNRVGAGMVSGEIAAGGIYGGVSNPENPALGTLAGGTAALAGQQLGQRVIGPGVGSIFASGMGQKVRRGMFAARGKTVAPLPAKLGPGEALVSRATDSFNIGDVRQTLEEAQRLKLPMSLADTDPRLRTLAGSAVRRSPVARDYAEQHLEPRARGQAERAISAVTRDFGPSVNMEAARAGFKQQARTDSRPFYEQAFARAAPVDPDIDAMLATPAGRRALNEAAIIAQNEGRDPFGLGFDFNAAGDVIGVQAPSMETLHMVKRGLDSVVEGSRGATGVLNRDDPAIAAVDGLRARFRERLGAIDENYRQGNAAYSTQMRNRDGLNFGYDAVAPRVNPDTLADATQRFPLDPVRTGYRSGMVDQIERTSLGRNPYDAIYGTPDQIAKASQLFPDTAPRFARQADLERQMAKTNYEALGGSPTAARSAADEQFAPAFGLQAAGEAGMSMATGLPPVGAIMGAVRSGVGDRWRMGLNGSAKAEQVAPMLLNPDPGAALRALERLQVQQQFAKRNRRAGGIFGASLGIPVVATTIE